MSYRSCPHCRSSNRASDERCYNCEKPLAAAPVPVSGGGPVDSPGMTTGEGLKEVAHSSAQAIVALGLVTAFGAALGLAWDWMEVDLPFFLEEVSLGVLCAVTSAFLLGKFQDLPDGLLYRRLLPAGAFGAIVGLCLYGVWWTFDPSAGSLAIGGFAGFLAGLPIVVSFGLFGGESRPLGGLEFLNMIVSLGVGALLAVFICADGEDFDMFPGITGLIGLIPTLVGGRVNMWEVLSYFNSDTSSSGPSRW